MKDYRLPQNRLQGFVRSYNWRRFSGDLDHTHSCQIICNELNLNKEQRIWFSLLFGHCYRSPMALVFIQQFPNINKVKVKHVQDWVNKNYHRLIYAKDCRYLKGKLPAIVETLQGRLGGDPLSYAYDDWTQSESKRRNFYTTLKTIRSIPYYGRMTAWLAMQCLYDVLDAPINYPDLLIKDPGSWSPYNGLCVLFDREEIQRTKEYTPNKDDLLFMQGKLKWLLEYMEEQLPYKEIDIFRIETHLCEYKKWFLDREYIGWNSAEQNELYIKYKQNFPDYNLYPFLKAQMTLDASIRGLRSDKRFFKAFGETGMILHINQLYDKMPDVFKKMGWNKDNFRIKEMFIETILSNKKDHPANMEKYKTVPKFPFTVEPSTIRPTKYKVII